MDQFELGALINYPVGSKIVSTGDFLTTPPALPNVPLPTTRTVPDPVRDEHEAGSPQQVASLEAGRARRDAQARSACWRREMPKDPTGLRHCDDGLRSWAARTGCPN